MFGGNDLEREEAEKEEEEEEEEEEGGLGGGWEGSFFFPLGLNGKRLETATHRRTFFRVTTYKNIVTRQVPAAAAAFQSSQQQQQQQQQQQDKADCSFDSARSVAQRSEPKNTESPSREKKNAHLFSNYI